jgi:hypothetical protein
MERRELLQDKSSIAGQAPTEADTALFGISMVVE